MTRVITGNTSGTIDYCEVLSFPSLKPATWDDETWICAVAVYFQKARLIDNIILDLPSGGESL